MMKNSVKYILTVISCLVLVGMIMAAVSRAADSASLTMTITPGTVSVVVSAASFDYGAVPLGSAKTSTNFVATNNGNVTEDFLIKGSNATYNEAPGEANRCPNVNVQDVCVWSLSNSPGADAYRYTYTPAGGSETNLSSSNQTLASNVIAGAASSFNLKFYTPTQAGSQTALGKSYSTNVTVSAVWAGQ